MERLKGMHVMEETKAGNGIMIYDVERYYEC
jgi:hypothetical protein